MEFIETVITIAVGGVFAVVGLFLLSVVATLVLHSMNIDPFKENTE